MLICLLQQEPFLRSGNGVLLQTQKQIQKFLLLTLRRLSVRVTKNLILIAEDIIVDIKLVCNRTLEANQRDEPI